MKRHTSSDTFHLRTKIAAGYTLILLLVGCIVYVWLNEWRELETLERENREVSRLRKEVHDVYVRVTELSLLLEKGDMIINVAREERRKSDEDICD